LSAFCEKSKVAYTRYADDLSFSADLSSRLQVVEKLVGELCEKLKSPKLKINHAKTARVSKRTSRRVTGLVLSNDRSVSLGRSEKRRIRASVHYFVTGRLSSEECGQLRGMLGFVNSVEPHYLDKLRRKFGPEVIREIQRY
jgi:hypothetical protein